jgi:hypothetical protein
MTAESWFTGAEAVAAGLADAVVDGDRARYAATLGDMIDAGVRTARAERDRELIPQLVAQAVRAARGITR